MCFTFVCVFAFIIIKKNNSDENNGKETGLVIKSNIKNIVISIQR